MCLISGFFIGFFIGRKTINMESKIEYIQLKTINGFVPSDNLIPIKETNPEIPNLPMKDVEVEIQYRDTGSIKEIERIVYQVVDTAKIIQEYIIKRDYELMLFDDINGRLVVFPSLQYNKLTALNYNFTPIQQKETVYKGKVWQPFVSSSYSTLDYIGIGGGIFYHDLGFEYQYNIDLRNNYTILPAEDKYFKRGNYHWFSGKYKF